LVQIRKKCQANPPHYKNYNCYIARAYPPADRAQLSLCKLESLEPVMIFKWNRGYNWEDIHRIIKLTDKLSDIRVILKHNKELESIIEERIKRLNEYS
jgi:hypothetical protein